MKQMIEQPKMSKADKKRIQKEIKQLEKVLPDMKKLEANGKALENVKEEAYELNENMNGRSSGAFSRASRSAPKMNEIETPRGSQFSVKKSPKKSAKDRKSNSLED